MGKDLARGAFSELDCSALAWHPGRYTRASYSVCTGVHSIQYHLREGRPMLLVTLRKARSALDAVELMNGINYLREHVPMDVHALRHHQWRQYSQYCTR